jgi:hypothetical protein
MTDYRCEYFATQSLPEAYLKLSCFGTGRIHLPETLPYSFLLTITGGRIFLTAIFKLYGTGAAYCRAIEDEKSQGEDRKSALR